MLISSTAKSQYYYAEATDIPISDGNDVLTAALNGGFNNPQFNEIDLNLDGVIDLVVFDRFKGLVKPYINAGIADSASYTYAPEYARLFPPMNEYLLTRDYNDDGKFDLYVGGFEILLYENTSTLSDGLSFQLVSKLQTINNPPSQTTIPITPSSFDYPGIYDIDGDKDMDVFIYDFRRVAYHRNLSRDEDNSFVPKYENRNKCWGYFSMIPNKTIERLPDSIIVDTCIRATRGERRKGLKHVESTAITPIDIDQNASTDLLISFDGTYRLRLLLNEDTIRSIYRVNSRMHTIIDSFPDYDVPVRLLSPAAYILDVDNDNKKDMIVASNHANISGVGPYAKEDVWFYKNIATDNSFQFHLESKSFLQKELLDFGRAAKPVFFDYNKDGLMDILIGNGGYLAADDSMTFIEQLALLRNNGTSLEPNFELIDRNYLSLPSLNVQHIREGLAHASPSIGDIDGDNDSDILLTQKDGTIYLFEDTSSAGSEAAFKFHNESFQSIKHDKYYHPIGTQLFDINKDGLLELIVIQNSSVECFKNFGTQTQPIFNMAIDSLYWVGGDTMRYHFKDNINFNLFSIGDSMEINNATKGDNNPQIDIVISKINPTQNYIECVNSLTVGNNRYDEFNTNAHMTFNNKTWEFRSTTNGFEIESIYLFEDQNQTHIIFGAPNGNNYFIENFSDTLTKLDEVAIQSRDFMTNYGNKTFINGANLNGDSLIDLVIGLNTGGIKILYGSESTGIKDYLYSAQKQDVFFDLLPIPADHFFQIQINKKLQNQRSNYELRDISGKLIKTGSFQGNTHRVSTTELPSGVYLLSLKNNDSFATQKLIIR